MNEEYSKWVQEIGQKLLSLLSLGLGVEKNELKDSLGGDELKYLLKINYYPPCPRPDLALGVPAHTDMCAITILVPNDVQGLQVFRDDHWFNVDYIPNALVIHIGDQLEVFLSFFLSFTRNFEICFCRPFVRFIQIKIYYRSVKEINNVIGCRF